MRGELPMSPVVLQRGCGIYEVGANFLRCFVTDGFRILTVEGRPITYEDLMTAYQWGREEAATVGYTKGENNG